MRSALTTSAWTGVGRIRSGHPAYGGVVPASLGWWVTLGGVRVLLAVALSVAAGWLVHTSPVLRPLVYLIALAGVIGGVKRGQRHYLEEKERAHSLTMLLGVPPARPYFWGTSAMAIGEAILILPVALAAGAWITPTSLAAVALVATAFVMARVGREVSAHVAVLLSEVKVPQYLFAVCGMAMGAGLLHIAPTPGRTLPLPSWSATLVVGGLLMALAHPVVRASAGAVMLLTVRTGSVPLAFRQRRLPLPLRLWTTSDRKTSSLTMGMLAIGVLLADRVAVLGPAAMAGLREFQRVDLLVAVCYVMAYMLASVAAEPLTIQETARRAPLLALVGIAPEREIWLLARAVLGPVTVVTTALGLVLWARFDLGVPVLTWLTAVLLVATGACSAVLAGKVPYLAPRSGGQASEASVGTMAKTVLMALWPATSALGFLADTAPQTSGVVVLVSAGLAGACVLVLLDLRRTIRLRCEG